MRRFENAAEDLLGHYPQFVPMLPGTLTQHLSGKSPFARRHGRVTAYLALRAGRVVGRIAAIVNRSHNDYYKDRTGFFGFFECEDAQETADSLVSTVSAQLADEGFTSLRGPYNPSINDECGLLVDGFDLPPVIGLTWNPSYYERLLTGCGFQRKIMSRGYVLPLADLQVPPRLERLGQRVAARSRARLRPINMDNLHEDLEIIREVYNSSLDRNEGFVPISSEDLSAAADDLRLLADPDFIQIAESDGQRAGVALSLPDINEFLIRTRRLPRFLRALYVFYLLKTRRPKGGRQVAYGISPRFRDKGLHAWLSHTQFQGAKAGYQQAALGWIQENNTEVLEMAEFVGGIYKWRWAILEKPLAEHSPPESA